MQMHGATLDDVLTVGLLPNILLTATTHNKLLRWLSTCARLSREWWRIARSSPVHGHQLPRVPLVDEWVSMASVKYKGDEDECARVLKITSHTLPSKYRLDPGCPGTQLSLRWAPGAWSRNASLAHTAGLDRDVF